MSICIIISVDKLPYIHRLDRFRIDNGNLLKSWFTWSCVTVHMRVCVAVLVCVCFELLNWYIYRPKSEKNMKKEEELKLANSELIFLYDQRNLRDKDLQQGLNLSEVENEKCKIRGYPFRGDQPNNLLVRQKMVESQGDPIDTFSALCKQYLRRIFFVSYLISFTWRPINKYSFPPPCLRNELPDCMHPCQTGACLFCARKVTHRDVVHTRHDNMTNTQQ